MRRAHSNTKPTRTYSGSVLLAVLFAFVCASATPAFADDESAVLPSDPASVDNNNDTETELARLEKNDTTATASAGVVPVPLKLLAPLEDLDLSGDGLLRTRDPHGMSVIPRPDNSEWAFEPVDTEIDASMLEIDGATQKFGVGHSVPSFFNANCVKRPRYRLDPEVRALQKILRKVGFRHLRRYFRSELRDQYRSDPSFRYADYVDRRAEISRLGRGNIDTQDLATETVVETTRSVFAGHGDQHERDIALVEWGPFRLDDGGSLTIEKDRRTSGGVHLVDEVEEVQPQGRSIFCNKSYDIDSSVKFRPRVHEALRGDDFEAVLGEFGGKVEIDFLTSILSRRFMTAEFELTHKPDRGAGFFVNFIVYLR